MASRDAACRKVIVTILGAGNVALANAAYLSAQGHQVRIWSALDDERAALAEAKAVQASGALSGAFPVAVFDEVEETLNGSAIVSICAPVFAHRTLMEAAAPFLNPAQAVVVHPVAGLSSLLLVRLLHARNVSATIIDLSTSLMTCRKSSPTSVEILRVKRTIEMAAIPSRAGAGAQSLLASIYGDRFRLVSNALEISLGNHNPVYHVAPMLCNLSRAERQEDWTIWDCITPGVARLIELVDDERMAVVAAFGFEGASVETYFREAHGAEGGDLNEIFRSMSRKLKGPIGPQGFDHRFITEDVPYGLVFFHSLGQAVGVPMPLTQTLIDLCTHLYDRDFVAEGHTLEALGLAAKSPSEILDQISSGLAEPVESLS